LDREANSDLLDLAVVLDLIVGGVEVKALDLVPAEAVVDGVALAFGFTEVAFGVVVFVVALVEVLVSTFFAAFGGATSFPTFDIPSSPTFFGRPRF
jgi:hypothetical protein